MTQRKKKQTNTFMILGSVGVVLFAVGFIYLLMAIWNDMSVQASVFNT